MSSSDRYPNESDLARDQRMLDAIGEGDMGAFEEIYALCRDQLFSLALRFTGNTSDAEDVLQETFSYLLGKLPGLRLRAKITTLLYPAIKNLSHSARRKSGRFASSEDGFDGLSALQEQQPSVEREELAIVLAGLSPDKREVLLLRVVDEFSMEEIAVALDIPEGTVKSRLHHALQWLREDQRTAEYFKKD